MKIDVDTDNPQKDSSVDIQNPTGIMSNMFYAMKGKSFDMKINDRGEVKSVAGMNELMNAMMNSLPGDERAKQAMAQVFQSQFNEESVKKMFAQSFNIFPEKPVKEGDTWTKTVSMGGMMAGETTTLYKVKDIDGNNAELELSSDLKINGTTGKQTGTMKLNVATGMVTNAVLDQKITSPMAMVSKTTIEGKEK
ncbi:MAG: hypothetical protein EOO46_20635 [Flavobacterium sp.]|nr:MAG: hypothetical protein EOO46_20635 [Flavobacterium sp.]